MGYTNTWDTLSMMTHNTNTHGIHIHVGYSLYDDTQYKYTWDTHTHGILSVWWHIMRIHMGYTHTWDTLCMMTHNTNTHWIHIHMGDSPYTLSMRICVHIRMLIKPPKSHVHGASQTLFRRRFWYSFSMCLIPKSLESRRHWRRHCPSISHLSHYVSFCVRWGCLQRKNWGSLPFQKDVSCLSPSKKNTLVHAENTFSVFPRKYDGLLFAAASRCETPPPLFFFGHLFIQEGADTLIVFRNLSCFYFSQRKKMCVRVCLYHVAEIQIFWHYNICL